MDDFYGNNNGNGYNNGGYNNNGYGSGYNNNGYGSNGYGSSGYNNGGYNNGQNFGYNSDYEPEQKGGAGLAIASFVLSLVNLLLCCTMLSIITVPPVSYLLHHLTCEKEKGNCIRHHRSHYSPYQRRSVCLPRRYGLPLLLRRSMVRFRLLRRE